MFEGDGNGAALSTAPCSAAGRHPANGPLQSRHTGPRRRTDDTVRVRGLGLEIVADGRSGRAAMIDPPLVSVATPQAFFDLLTAATQPGAGRR